MIKLKKIRLTFKERVTESIKIKKGENTLKYPRFNNELKRAVLSKFKKNYQYNFNESDDQYIFLFKTKEVRVSIENNWLLVREYRRMGDVTASNYNHEYLLDIVD